jgi:hypothetical protein
MNYSMRNYPAGNTTSSTFSLYCYARQSEGSGAFSNATPVSLPALSILFPNGRADSTTVTAIRDACIQHLLNNSALTAWWAPESGTIESNLRAALDNATPPGAWATAPSWVVSFDGQFGSVLVA